MQETLKMQLKFYLITLITLMVIISFINAQVDDNLVPHPIDDSLTVPGVPGTVDGLDDISLFLLVALLLFLLILQVILLSSI